MATITSVTKVGNSFVLIDISGVENNLTYPNVTTTGDNMEFFDKFNSDSTVVNMQNLPETGTAEAFIKTLLLQ